MCNTWIPPAWFAVWTLCAAIVFGMVFALGYIYGETRHLRYNGLSRRDMRKLKNRIIAAQREPVRALPLMLGDDEVHQ